MAILVGKSVNRLPGGSARRCTVEHNERTYMDDEGLEYVELGGCDEEAGSIMPVSDSPGGRLWGADEAWGGYDAE